MRNYILLVILLALCGQGFGQTAPRRNQLQQNNATGYDYQGLGARKALYPPYDSFPGADSGNIIYKYGRLYFRDSSNYKRLLMQGEGGGQNLANAALTANGSYLHDWNNYPLRVFNLGTFSIQHESADASFPGRLSRYQFNFDTTTMYTPMRLGWSLTDTDQSYDSAGFSIASGRTATDISQFNLGGESYATISTKASSTGLIDMQAGVTGAISELRMDNATMFLSPASFLRMKLPVVTSADTLVVQTGAKENTFGTVQIAKIAKTDFVVTGGGLSWKTSATAPTGSDTGKIWVKTPAFCGVYDVYTYVTGYSWTRYGWLSIDGVFSTIAPLNMVLAGQSNCGGIFAGGDTARSKGIIGYSSGATNGGIDNPTAWQPVYIGLSPFYGINNNPAHAFAKEAQRRGYPIVRILAAYQGGTGIEHWNGRGGNSPYLLDTLRQRLSRSGIDTVHVMMWVHGESAYPTSDVDGGYYSDFKCLQDSLYSPLTKAFIKSHTFIISAGMGSDTGYNTIRSGAQPAGAMERLLHDRDPYTSYSSSFGLTLCDDVHFCGTALDTLGRRVFSEYRKMPRNNVDEQPKFTYDFIGDPKAYLSRISPYNNGIVGSNITALTFGLFNTNGAIIQAIGSNNTVQIGGGAWGFTGSPTLKVAGGIGVAGSNYSALVSANLNLNGTTERVTTLGNYDNNFTTSGGVSDDLFLGFNAGYNTNRPAVNSVVQGSYAGYMMNPGGFGDFFTFTGFESGYGNSGIQNTFYGSRSGKSAIGSNLTAVGVNAAAIDGNAYVDAAAFGYNAKWDKNGQIVLGDSDIVELKIGKLTKFKITNTAPTNGFVWAYNSISGQYEPTASTDNSITTGSRTTNGDYTQNWNHKQLYIDTVSHLRLFQLEQDVFLSAYKVKNILSFENDYLGLSNQNVTTLRKKDNSADSIYVGTQVLTGKANLFYNRGAIQSYVSAGDNTAAMTVTGTGNRTSVFSSSTSVAMAHILNNAAATADSLQTSVTVSKGKIVVSAIDSVYISSSTVTSADSVFVPGRYNSTDKTNKFQKIAVVNLLGASFNQTANVTVTGNTETTLIGSGTGSLTLTPTDWAVGRTYDFKIYGILATDASNPATSTFRCKIGSTTIATTGSVFNGTGTTGRNFEIELHFTVRSVSSSGTVMTFGFYNDKNGGSNSIDNGTSTSTIDMTTNQTLDFTVQQSDGSAGNTISSYIVFLKRN